MDNWTLENVLSEMQPFEPVAYYDKHLDTIRVQIIDCSIWEERCHKVLTVYHDNRKDREFSSVDIVGFSIKGIRHLLNELGMPTDGAFRLADLLDAIVKAYPHEATMRVAEYYREQKEFIREDLHFSIAA